MGTFWHPFADMSAVDGHELVIVSGQGCRLTAADGREFIDATAALWFNNVGYGRAEIADAADTQMRTLAAYSNFGPFATAPTLELADRLAAISPQEDCKVFFTSGGSDAVDTAVKMVRRYWDLLGQPDRTWIITRDRAYHGMHMAGTSLAGIAANKAGHGNLDARTANIAWDSADAVAAQIDELGAEHVAAFFCEPVIGAGGVYPPPPGYLEAARQVCRERGVLFVADEVITAYGRVAAWTASERWHLDPDLILTAKGLTSGYLPMGAVLVAGRIAEPFWTTGGLWRHGYTYSGHAAASAVALANLDIIEREGLIARVDALQPVMPRIFGPLADHSAVREVRAGVGLLAAVQIRPEVLGADPNYGSNLVLQLRERGVLTRMLADGSVQISPPFIVEESDLRLMAGAIDGALRAMGSSTPAPRPTLDVALLPEQTRDDEGGFESSDDRLRAEVPPHHI